MAVLFAHLTPTEFPLLPLAFVAGMVLGALAVHAWAGHLPRK